MKARRVPSRQSPSGSEKRNRHNRARNRKPPEHQRNEIHALPDITHKCIHQCSAKNSDTRRQGGWQIGKRQSAHKRTRIKTASPKLNSRYFQS